MITQEEEDQDQEQQEQQEQEGGHKSRERDRISSHPEGREREGIVPPVIGCARCHGHCGNDTHCSLCQSVVHQTPVGIVADAHSDQLICWLAAGG